MNTSLNRLADAFLESYLPNVECFRPEWDVPDFARSISDSLSTEISLLQQSPGASGRRRLHVLLGANGSGKTHIIGRIVHQQVGKVLFIDASIQGSDSNPLTVIRNAVVTAIRSQPVKQSSPLTTALVDILEPELRKVLLPLAGDHSHRIRFLQDPKGYIRQLLREVSRPEDVRKLTAWLMNAVPEIANAAYARALLLTSNQVYGNDMYEWLANGQLSPERALQLSLVDVSLDSQQLLMLIGYVFSAVKCPIFLFLDQLDKISAIKDSGTLSSTLMGWLQKVPGLMIVIGSLESAWREEDLVRLPSFNDRCCEHILPRITASQVRELVTKRLPANHPVDLDSLEEFQRLRKLPVRRILQICHEKLMEWEQNGRVGRVTFPILTEDGTSADTPILVTMPTEETVPARPITPPAPVIADVPPVPEVPVEAAVVPAPQPKMPPQSIEEFWDDIHARVVAASTEWSAIPPYDMVDAIHKYLQVMKETSGVLPPDTMIDQLTRYSKNNPDPKGSVVVVQARVRDRTTQVAVTVGQEFETGHHVRSWAVQNMVDFKPDTYARLIVLQPQRTEELNFKSSFLDTYRKLKTDNFIHELYLPHARPMLCVLEATRQFWEKATHREIRINNQILSLQDAIRALAALPKFCLNSGLLRTIFDDLPANRPFSSMVPQADSHAASGSSSPSQVTAQPKVVAQAVAQSSTPSVAVEEPELAASPQPAARPKSGPINGYCPSRYVLPDDKRYLVDSTFDKLVSRGLNVRPVETRTAPHFARVFFEPTVAGSRLSPPLLQHHTQAVQQSLQLHRPPLMWESSGLGYFDVAEAIETPISLPEIAARCEFGLSQTPSFPVGLGLDLEPVWFNFAAEATPHMLIAGGTGAGKTTFLRAAVAGLAHRLSHTELQFTPLISSASWNFPGESPYLSNWSKGSDNLKILENIVQYIRERLADLQKLKIARHHVQSPATEPTHVIVIDDLQKLLGESRLRKILVNELFSLWQNAGRAGVHFLVATAPPSQQNTWDSIKPAFRSARVFLAIPNDDQARMISGDIRPARLVGHGDLLFESSEMHRLQGLFVTDDELMSALRVH